MDFTIKKGEIWNTDRNFLFRGNLYIHYPFISFDVEIFLTIKPIEFYILVKLYIGSIIVGYLKFCL